MRMKLRARLVRKPIAKAAVETQEATGEDVKVALATRARKRLNDEYVSPGGWQLQSY